MSARTHGAEGGLHALQQLRHRVLRRRDLQWTRGGQGESGASAMDTWRTGRERGVSNGHVEDRARAGRELAAYGWVALSTRRVLLIVLVRSMGLHTLGPCGAILSRRRDETHTGGKAYEYGGQAACGPRAARGRGAWPCPGVRLLQNLQDWSVAQCRPASSSNDQKPRPLYIRLSGA